ncbi:MAG TPA: YceI family protein [Gammaproteobacteria bacterium]|nr:YceI family protein [Gammaproteobacteria bacterium]|tara:strand:+ start:3417 stop:4004 length:588 start_codon:yes stop_codon:yes gene_type:complete
MGTPLLTVQCLFLSGLSIFSAAASAQWTLNNEASTLSFVTVKADHVAEVHTFDELSGAIQEDGQVLIEIALASVNTLVPIRNERMQSMLFETDLFPRGSITAQINTDQLANMALGSSETMGVDFSLELHNQTQTYNATVLVSRQENGLMATTLKPIVVNAGSFDLVSGVESLREVAGLPSISRAVPVSFTVVFDD